jgi:hypothetical protein
MKKLSRKKKIHLPINGDQETFFFTKGELRIATGYNKIIISPKKTLIEFLEKNIILENLLIPHYLKWMDSEKSEWMEYRSKDYCRVKIKYSKKTNMFYCFLSELTTRMLHENFIKYTHRIK